MKKQSVLIALSLFILTSSCRKDEGLSDDEKSRFIKVYGTSSQGVDIVQTADEGFILLGTTQGESSIDIYLKCVDKYGHHVWSKTYDGPAGGRDESAYDLELLADGGFAISGTTIVLDSTGVIPIRSTYLIITDYLGSVRYQSAYNFGLTDPIKHEQGFGLTVSSTGDIYIASRSEYIRASDGELLFIGALRKIDAGSHNVTTIETKLEQSAGANIGLRDVILLDGETKILTTGDVDINKDSTLGENLCYVEYDATNFGINKSDILGGPEEDLGYKLIETAEGDILISGYTTNGGEKDMGLFKISGIGTLSPVVKSWKFPTALSQDDACLSVVDQIDGYVLVGYSESGGDRQMIITKISKDLGSVLWTKDYGYVDYDEAISVISTSDNGLAIVGTSSDERGNRIMTLLKLDSKGNLK